MRFIVGGSSSFLTKSQTAYHTVPHPLPGVYQFCYLFPSENRLLVQLICPFGSLLASVSSCPPSQCTPASSDFQSFSHLLPALFLSDILSGSVFHSFDFLILSFPFSSKCILISALIAFLTHGSLSYLLLFMFRLAFAGFLLLISCVLA